MRTITVFQSQTSETEVIELDDSQGIRTWGELQPLISFDLSNKKVVVQETQVILELDEAQLPEGDFTLFIFVAQSKAGAGVDYSTKEGKNKIIAMAGNNLRRLIRKLVDKGEVKIDTTLETAEQREALLNHFHGSKKRKTLSQAEKAPVKPKAKKKKPAKKVAKKAAKQTEIKFVEDKDTGDTLRIKPMTPEEAFPTPSKKTTQLVELQIEVDQKEVLDKLDEISESMTSAITRLEELPDLIAEKIKETRKIVEAADSLRQEANRLRAKLSGVQ